MSNFFDNDEIERKFAEANRSTLTMRQAANFRVWMDLLDGDPKRAIELAQQRGMETTQVGFGSDATNPDGDSIVDVLSRMIVENGHTFEPWTLMQMRVTRREMDLFDGQGFWYLAFSNARDAVVARILLGERIVAK